VATFYAQPSRPARSGKLTIASNSTICSGSTPKYNQLLADPQSTYSTNFVEIYPQLFWIILLTNKQQKG